MIRITAVLAMTLAIAQAALGQDYQLLQTVNPDFSGEAAQDDDPGPEFGYALASDDDMLLIGMPRFVASNNEQRGSADRFQLVGHEWQFMARGVEGLQGFQGARCGEAVAVAKRSVSEYHRYHGCPFADRDGFTNNGFARMVIQSGSCIPTGNANEVRFGTSIDATYMSDGTPIYAIGARGGDRVRVGRPCSPSEFNATLTGVAGESFGESVSIAVGGPSHAPLWLAVGAPGWNTGRGKVYVYFYSRIQEQWVLTEELIAPVNPQPGDNFGASVLYHPGVNQLDPTDDLLIVGAAARRIDGSSNAATRGTVSVYQHGAQTGTFQHQGDVSFSQTICTFAGQFEACEDVNQHMNFGHALALDDQGNLWIGAPRFDQAGSAEVGRVYRAQFGNFHPTVPEGWWVLSMLSPGPLGDDCGFLGSARSGGRFGWALAMLDGGGVAVGYPRRGCQVLTIPPSDPGPRRGQVRIYGIPDSIFSDRFEQ